MEPPFLGSSLACHAPIEESGMGGLPSLAATVGSDHWAWPSPRLRRMLGSHRFGCHSGAVACGPQGRAPPAAAAAPRSLLPAARAERLATPIGQVQQGDGLLLALLAPEVVTTHQAVQTGVPRQFRTGQGVHIQFEEVGQK